MSARRNSVKYTDAHLKRDLAELAALLEQYANITKKRHGGAIKMRSFTADTVNGKPYNGPDIRVVIDSPVKSDGTPRVIKNGTKPERAAKRVFKSLCNNMSRKGGCDITFTMKETTQNSKGKVYGPYLGIKKNLKNGKSFTVEGSKIVPKAEYTVRTANNLKTAAKKTNKRTAFY